MRVECGEQGEAPHLFSIDSTGSWISAGDHPDHIPCIPCKTTLEIDGSQAGELVS